MTTQDPCIQTTAEEESDLSRPEFDGFVIGIGASAGGLEALERFFTHCPADTDAAFVVIQHLSPDHKSMMHDLLGRYTDMPVTMVKEGMRISANRIFLIPAGTIMRIANGIFHLTPKSPHLLSLPIDIFFSSLADSVGRRAVGVVLSGTGSDGSRGAVAINAAGGFLLAQDPNSAKFDGMPASIIATGVVDAVLPAEKLADRIHSHIRNIPVASLADEAPPSRVPLSHEEAFEGILGELLQSGNIDFHDYKLATLLRRIERRMQVRHLNGLESYLALLKDDPEECVTLRRELLIPVTSFFRDSEIFQLLDERAIRHIVAEAPANANLRAWIAGTSTGEEAYSIAMLFLEAFEHEKKWPSLKIFATDVNQHSINFAAAGHYPESAAAELTRERLERFFSRSGESYVVKPELRQCIVFAAHNLLADPPFTRMNLVSCRNTLIYFTSQAQKRALNRLQFALLPEGYLFLGASESLAGASTGFTTISSKHKLFQRTGRTAPLTFEKGNAVLSQQKRMDAASARAARYKPPFEDGRAVDEGARALISEYAPPSMLVNERHEIIHLFGKIQPFFQAREGAASLELGKVLPSPMVPVASALLFKAVKENQRMVSDYLRVETSEGEVRLVRLSVQPLPNHGKDRWLLLSFEEHPAQGGPQPPEPIDVDAETMERVDILERELAATRESLQATIEELETSNEELQATNEELMASNEELQSANEELQSVNEELNTVNAEYQEKASILNRLNADLDSMSKAVGVATVFVGEDLHLNRFSPDAVGIFKLRDGDLGRPLDEINHILDYPGFMEDLAATMRSERVVEKEVTAHDGRLFLVRILPYGIPSSTHRGAVATFVDITSLRDNERLQAIINALPEHIAVLTPDGTIALVNKAWSRFAQANGDPDLRHSGPGANYLDACLVEHTEDGHQARAARQGVKAVLEGSQNSFSLQYPCHSPEERRWFVMNTAPILGGEFGAVVSHINIGSWLEQPPDTPRLARLGAEGDNMESPSDDAT